MVIFNIKDHKNDFFIILGLERSSRRRLLSLQLPNPLNQHKTHINISTSISLTFIELKLEKFQ